MKLRARVFFCPGSNFTWVVQYIVVRMSRTSFSLSTESVDRIKTTAENLIDAFTAVRNGDVQCLQEALLRANPPSITDSDQHGRTMLHIACSSSSKQELDVVRFLLEQGSGVNVQDKRNNTPLHNAARISGQDVVKLLLTYGCDPQLKNADGQTALGLAQAKARGQVTRVLRTHVTELTSVPRAPGCPRLVRAMCTSLIVRWNSPESVGPAEYPITTYDLRYSQRGLLQPWITRGDFNTTGPMEIDDLKCGTDYVMSVRAVNRNGYGSWSVKSLTMTTSMDSSGGSTSTNTIGHAIEGTPRLVAGGLGVPPPRSESLQTLSDQRNAAEQRALDLQRHRTDAEKAMLRIEKEREIVVEQLKKAQGTTKSLRSTLRTRDATIAEMKEQQRQQQQEQEQQDSSTVAALKVASSILLESNTEEDDDHKKMIDSLQARIKMLEGEVRRSERRCQTAEAMGVVSQKETLSLRAGRKDAEAMSNKMQLQMKEMEQQIIDERKHRTEAEEHSKQMSSIVGQLQRQLDAAEAVAEELNSEHGGAGGTGVALNSKTMLETMKQLQDGLNQSNERLFALAGVEARCADLDNEKLSMETSLFESEEEIVRLEKELVHVKMDRDGLREQRDIAEDVSEEVRNERDRLDAVVKDLKLKQSVGSEGSGGGGDDNTEEKMFENNKHWVEESKLAQERQDVLKEVLSRAADEVLVMMQSHQEWIEKTEKVEMEFASRAGFEHEVVPDLPGMEVVPVLPPRRYMS